MTDTKIQGIFNGFTNLELIEFKVPIVCLVTGCVPRRRDARYIDGLVLGHFAKVKNFHPPVTVLDIVVYDLAVDRKSIALAILQCYVQSFYTCRPIATLWRFSAGSQVCSLRS
jgi:hypothetical protein